MTVSHLDLHPASLEERVNAFRNVHEFWGRGLSLEEFVERRLASPQHNFARWFVGCLEGQVITSLGAYPLQLCLDGQRRPAIAIGSVHTLPRYRGRGFAPRLLSWVEDYYRQAGVEWSLLYSDIDPAYYARLGYERCPSWEGWRDVPGELPSTVSQSAAEPALRLVPLTVTEHRQSIELSYERDHAQLPLWIRRNEAYWNYLFAKQPGDTFYGIFAATGKRVGYARVAVHEGVARLQDLAAGGQLPGADLLDALLAEAAARQWRRLGGWLPHVPEVADRFTLQIRQREITMLKSLDPHKPVREEYLAAAQYVHEIDHV